MINTVERAYKLAEREEISLFKLCETNGINYSTIITAKRRRGQLSVNTIGLLCEAMGITMSEFFQETTPSNCARRSS